MVERITCIPFPDQEVPLTAEISARQCLINQAAGLIRFCKTCKTGRMVKKNHPEIAVNIRKVNYFNPTGQRLPDGSYRK